MKRFLLALAAAIALPALVPLVASAQMIQVGATTSPLIAPVCPPGVTQSNCRIVLTEVTALESSRDGVAYPTTITKPGEIAAFSLGVSAISSNAAQLKSDINYLNTTYGGTASAQLTVLRPVGKRSAQGWRVAAQTPVFQLAPYLGQVVQFPLIAPLPVVPGEVIALTIPTWAPVLTFDLSASQYAYRQSRTAQTQCNGTKIQFHAQTAIGATAHYGCSYTGTRVEYSATEITTPVAS